MRITKGIFTVAATLVVVLFGISAFAQLEELRNTTPAQRAKIETGFMKNRLKLTRAQTGKVQAINLKYAQRMEPVIKGPEGRLMKIQQANTISHEKDAELKMVLSGEQYQGYLASKEEMRQKVLERVVEKRPRAGN